MDTLFTKKRFYGVKILLSDLQLYVKVNKHTYIREAANAF